MAMVIGLFTYKSLQTSRNQSVYAVEPCSTPTPSPSVSPSPTPTATPTISPSPTPTPTPVSIQNVYLTEFMACPASGNEWLELYNGNASTVTVTNWQIIDDAGNKKFINGIIPPNDFLKFEWTGSLLNNTGDSFSVVTSTAQTIGSAAYDSCSTGISFVYEEGEWVSALQSPGEETTLSSASLPNSTAAALLKTYTPATASDAGQLALIGTSQENTARITSPPPFALPTLLASNTTAQQPALTAPQSSSNSWPAISVIIGGLVQLLPSSALFYGNTKKYFS